MHVFLRNGSGLLVGEEAHRIGDDWLIRGFRTDLTPTGKKETLLGWGESDGLAEVFETDSGIEVIVPERSVSAVFDIPSLS